MRICVLYVFLICVFVFMWECVCVYVCVYVCVCANVCVNLSKCECVLAYGNVCFRVYV